LTRGLIGIAGAHRQGVQLFYFHQTNEDVTAHPKSRELRLELPQKGSPPGARLSAGLESRRDMEPTKFKPPLLMLD